MKTLEFLPIILGSVAYFAILYWIVRSATNADNLFKSNMITVRLLAVIAEQNGVDKEVLSSILKGEPLNRD